jgi:UDP-N-acetylglucosamine--N-acetylmuramyl-(pentapeptide) pyrophosphoryl-undecaprenol N-acetylglucosamine transferase
MPNDSVLIAGGGTGGHLYPGLAVADELRRRRPDLPLQFVGTRAGLEATIVPRAGYPLRFIRVGGIAGKAWSVRLANALRIPVGTVQSMSLVMREGARVVVGVGGYASGPVVLAAKLLRRRTLVLEQNAAPGSTNRILAPLVDRVAVAFPGTARRLPGRVVVTGNPVRSGMDTVPDRRVAEVRRLLIFGGSRGARGLNDAVMEALPRLEGWDIPLEILHQTGPADEERVRAAYGRTGLDAQVVPYIDDMAGAYAGADLVVCRAGATTVAELSAVGRAAIMVPLPHATGGHQEENAREMADCGAAILLCQSEAGAGRLAGLIHELLGDPRRRQQMEEAARGLGSPGAAAAVADIVLELYDGELRRTAAGNGRPA